MKDKLLFDTKEIYLKLREAADSVTSIPEAEATIRKMYEMVGGNVYFTERTGSFLQAEGVVKLLDGEKYTLSHMASEKYIPGDMQHIAEDLTMAYYRSKGGKVFNTYGLIAMLKNDMGKILK